MLFTGKEVILFKNNEGTITFLLCTINYVIIPMAFKFWTQNSEIFK